MATFTIRIVTGRILSSARCARISRFFTAARLIETLSAPAAAAPRLSSITAQHPRPTVSGMKPGVQRAAVRQSSRIARDLRGSPRLCRGSTIHLPPRRIRPWRIPPVIAGTLRRSHELNALARRDRLLTVDGRESDGSSAFWPARVLLAMRYPGHTSLRNFPTVRQGTMSPDGIGMRRAYPLSSGGHRGSSGGRRVRPGRSISAPSLESVSRRDPVSSAAWPRIMRAVVYSIRPVR